MTAGGRTSGGQVGERMHIVARVGAHSPRKFRARESRGEDSRSAGGRDGARASVAAEAGYVAVRGRRCPKRISMFTSRSRPRRPARWTADAAWVVSWLNCCRTPGPLQHGRKDRSARFINPCKPSVPAPTPWPKTTARPGNCHRLSTADCIQFSDLRGPRHALYAKPLWAFVGWPTRKTPIIQGRSVAPSLDHEAMLATLSSLFKLRSKK